MIFVFYFVFTTHRAFLKKNSRAPPLSSLFPPPAQKRPFNRYSSSAGPAAPWASAAPSAG